MQDINRKYGKIKLIFSLLCLPIGAVLSFLFIICPIINALCEILKIVFSNILVLIYGIELQLFVMLGILDALKGGCVLAIAGIYTVALYIILMEIIENKRIEEIKQREQDEFFRNLV